MERRRMGKTDMGVSVLGFGGSEIGYQRVSAKTVARLLGGALDAGLNVIDTAECYEDSEELIGKALGGRRREVYLFSKCGHARAEARSDWRPGALLRSIERSLSRLATDHLDLIQLHSCGLEVLQRRNDVALAQLGERAAVELDEVEVVGAQALAAALDAGQQRLRPPVGAAPAAGVTALGEQMDVAAAPADGLADQLLAVLVALGRVDDVEAGVERAAEQALHRADAGPLVADLRAAEAEHAGHDVGPAEPATLHRSATSTSPTG